MTRSEAREDLGEPRRKRMFRCRDMMCGGLDCATCYSEQEAREYLAELDAEPQISRQQELFDHMEREHGLVLTESEMDEIELIVMKMNKPK